MEKTKKQSRPKSNPVNSQEDYTKVLQRTQGQRKQVLRHILTEGSITSMQAFSEYQITRLSSVIYDLRYLHGVPIKTIMLDGNNCKYAKYIIGE